MRILSYILPPNAKSISHISLHLQLIPDLNPIYGTDELAKRSRNVALRRFVFEIRRRRVGEAKRTVYQVSVSSLTSNEA